MDNLHASNFLVLFLNVRNITNQSFSFLPGTTLCCCKRGDVNDVDSDGHTALFYAATSGSVETIDLLIQDWADIEAQEKNGDTPLYSAVAAHKPKAVLALLKHGADVNMQVECYILFFCTAGSCR